jgi:hypothetical protein
MLRSFIVSTMAFTCPVPNAMLLVTVAVPVVSRLMAVVDVPEVGSARRGVALNWRYASMSKYFSRIHMRTRRRMLLAESGPGLPA